MKKKKKSSHLSELSNCDNVVAVEVCHRVSLKRGSTGDAGTLACSKQQQNYVACVNGSAVFH